MSDSLQYGDVFNNPYNNYVCPTFPTCANSGADDFYFEFIDKKSVGIVSTKNTIMSLDLSDISSYARSWSQETKIINANDSIYITGEEFSPQCKHIEYEEVKTFPTKYQEYQYYFTLKFRYSNGSKWKVKTIEVSILDDFNLEPVITYLNKLAPILGLDMKFDYIVNENANNSFIVDSTIESFKFDMMSYPMITLKKGEEVRINTYCYNDGKLIESLDDIKNSMDKNGDNQADVYWFGESEPNQTISSVFDTNGDGFVDVWWQDEDDNPTGDIIIGGCDNILILNTIKFKQVNISEYFKYINGAFKGIVMKFKYPTVKNGYNHFTEMEENQKYVNFVYLPESFKTSTGNVVTLYMSGPLYNGNKFIDIVDTNKLWQTTSLVYMNVGSDSDLIRGLVLNNPHSFPIAVTFIKYN